MHVRTLTAAAAAVLAVAVQTAGAQAVAAPAEADRVPAARILTYDARGAAEFRTAVDRGAQVWNDTVASVELRPAAAGRWADIRVLADNGWPRALTTSLGNGTVYMGRQAVQQGYDTVRIAAHEFGHILGLPDRKPGPCSSLMSGSTAGTACTNPYPDAVERARVEANFGGSAAAAAAEPPVAAIVD
ncbi:snapalysin family zinc-dependent metalloprotease [Streptomyces poriticola]|uniref:snapalysin family zinc-dependent metalloprotease n=1 Tax=Streptomyces poriticola TaxID=3120506 RepID=UPI002FCE3F22